MHSVLFLSQRFLTLLFILYFSYYLFFYWQSSTLLLILWTFIICNSSIIFTPLSLGSNLAVHSLNLIFLSPILINSTLKNMILYMYFILSPVFSTIEYWIKLSPSTFSFVIHFFVPLLRRNKSWSVRFACGLQREARVILRRSRASELSRRTPGQPASSQPSDDCA